MSDVRRLLLAEDLNNSEVAELLSPYGFADPHDIDTTLQRMCPTLADRMVLAEYLPVVLEAAARSVDPQRCLLQLERLAEGYGQRGALYRSLGGNPGALNTFFTVVGASSSLADLLALNPEYLDIIADTEQLVRQRQLEELRLEASQLSEAFTNKESILNALRRMRRREYLRIGARELTGLGTFTEVVQEISDLACALVSQTLSVCHDSLDYPSGEKPDSFVVIAFGKLGARELNYSSDIDLALVWDTPPAGEESAVSTFYQKLSQLLIQSLSELSGEGRMYRVDMRLRPFGSSGPVGSSVAQFLNYYESWSEPWERQALIKARTIAGPPALRERVDSFIRDFTFGRPIDALSIGDILAVKERSEAHQAKAGEMDRQVKHGWGGIRDVEFTVQLLQLVAGSSHPEAQIPATLDALAVLYGLKVVSEQEESALASSYVFLRQVEHRLQLVDELPIAVLPDDPAKLQRLALSMGYRDDGDVSARAQFEKDYAVNTRTVRNIHERLFKQFLSHHPDQAVDIARLVESEDGDSQILSQYGFRDTEDAARRLKQITFNGHEGKTASQSQRRFLQMLPDLLASIAKSPDPSLSLSLLQQMAEATGAPLHFFQSIGANPKALDVFTRLCGASEFLAGALIRRPEYIDMFADSNNLARARSLSSMEKELASRVEAEQPGDNRLNALRRFRLREFLRIGVRDVAGITRVITTTAEISLLAEACIRVAYLLATGTIDGQSRLPGKLSILGMGKLGGRELHYSSDVDIVCVFQEGKGAVDAYRAFEKCVRSILDILSRLTEEGRGFKVDLRLRPEGKAGMLVLSLDGYSRYLSEDIQVWERQALVRARPVAGDVALARRLLEKMREAVWGRPLTEEDLTELRHIKKRIENERSKQSDNLIDLKLGPGGILDVEFTVQILQLAYGGVINTLRESNTWRALKAIGRMGVLAQQQVNCLKDAYLFLRRAENRLQMVSERSEDGVSADPESLAAFARRLGYAQKKPSAAAQTFLNDLRRHTNGVRKIHEITFFETDLTREAWEAPRKFPV